MFKQALALACAGALMFPAVAVAAPTSASPVDRAEQRVADAEKDLRAATATARDLRTQADSAKKNQAEAQRDLGNFAREAYRGGPLDAIGLESLFDSPNPSDALRRAAVLELLTEHQDAQVEAALAEVGQADVLRQQATVLVSEAKAQLRAAEASLKAVKGNRNLLGQVASGSSAGIGTATITKRCLSAEVVVDICGKPPWSERNLTFDAVVIERYVHSKWPQIKDVGGWRPSDPFPDHPSGRAVDIMMPNAGAAKDVPVGNEIAKYFQEHAAEYGIYYMIWRQRMWKASDPVGQWTGMSDRGSPTANHMDHVHITVTDGTSGSGFELAEIRSHDLAKLLAKGGKATKDK